jgi:hypothetical protein
MQKHRIVGPLKVRESSEALLYDTFIIVFVILKAPYSRAPESRLIKEYLTEALLCCINEQNVSVVH